MGNLDKMKKLKELLETKGFDYVVINTVYEKDWRGQKVDTGKYQLIGSHTELRRVSIVPSPSNNDTFEVSFLNFEFTYFKKDFSPDEVESFLESLDVPALNALQEKKTAEVEAAKNAAYEEEKKKEEEKEKVLAEKESKKRQFLASINMLYIVSEKTYFIHYESDEGDEGKIYFNYSELWAEAPFGIVYFEDVKELKDFRRKVRSKLL